MPAPKPTLPHFRPLLLVSLVVATLLPFHRYVLTSPQFRSPYPSTSNPQHQLPSVPNLSAPNQHGQDPLSQRGATQTPQNDQRPAVATTENVQLDESSAKSEQAMRASNIQRGEHVDAPAINISPGKTSADHAETGISGSTNRSRLEAVDANTLPRASECASFVVYDKPMKTGSTAVTQSLKRLLTSRNANTTFAVCERVQCRQLARAICAGEAQPQHLLQHMDGEHGLLECLREKGYYVMTSIREPLDRWESAYLYNQRERANHYGISWKESYDMFMSRFPPCALLGYYDGGDRQCRDDVEGRIEQIVQRYDEIVDLYDEPRGQVERLLQRFVREVNKSPRDAHFQDRFDLRLLANETKLYEGLKRRRQQLLARPSRVLCE